MGAASDKRVFVRDATGLVRQISSIDALGMALANIGLLFVFNTIVFGPGFWPTANPITTFLFGLLLVLPSVGVYTLMSIAMPRTGGDYVWVSRITHPSLGFMINVGLTAVVLSFIGIGTPTASEWAMAEMFYDLGKIYGNQSYLNIANMLQISSVTFVIACVLCVVAAVVVIASTKWATAIVRYWMYASLIVAIVFAVTVLSAGTSTFISNFNALSGGNYDAVVKAGEQLGSYPGVPPAFSSATLYASAASSALGYLGFNASAYVGGEVRRVNRSQFVAQFGGVLIFAAFSALITAVEYFGEGPAFANAMAILWAQGSSSLPYLTTPLASGMSMFWTQNPILIIMFNLSYVGVIEVFNIVVFLTFSRNLFAWSFDRVMPSKFAEVNERTHTPVNAIIIMLLVSFLYVYMTIYQYGVMASYYSYGSAGEIIGIALVAIAALAFPFVRKDLFDSADPIVRRRLLGVPLITILGLLTVIVSGIVVYAILLPTIGGIQFGTILIQGIIPTYILGIVIFGVAWAVRRHQRIDLSLLHKELPPE